MASVAEMFSIAIQHHQAGRLRDAERVYRELIERDPGNANAHNNLGLALAMQGRMEDAAASLRSALNLDAHHAEAHCNLGNVLNREGRLNEAVEHYRRAIELRPGYAQAHCNLGTVFQAQGSLADAAACFGRALELNPRFAEAVNNLGSVLQELNRFDEAVALHRQALEINPRYASAAFNLGTAFMSQKRPGEAAAWFRSAIALDAQNADAYGNLALALQEQSRLEEANECYRRALELRPSHTNTLLNMGVGLKAIGRFEDAAACYRRVLELNANHAGGLWNMATLTMLQGDLANGWPGYESRWKTGDLPVRDFAKPRWSGEGVERKTVLVWAEQGLGDTLQFVRYLRMVKERGARVVFECPGALVRLLGVAAESGDPRQALGIDQVVREGQDLPEFDFQVPLLSLPGIFGTRLETIPAEVPYLFADEELVVEWNAKLAAMPCFAVHRPSQGDGARATHSEAVGTAHPTKRFLVGINWQGRQELAFAKRRDIPVEMFERLAGVPGVRMVSIQKSEIGDQRSEFGGQESGNRGAQYGSRNAEFGVRSGDRAEPAIIDLGEIDKVNGAFMDTAAIMMNLDLVITSDTSVAHLAGALGVPVWVALSFVPDWRWMLDRSDSPWYPTMRLFRQKRLGDWQGVFEEIEAALRERVEKDKG